MKKHYVLIIYYIYVYIHTHMLLVCGWKKDIWGASLFYFLFLCILYSFHRESNLLVCHTMTFSFWSFCKRFHLTLEIIFARRNLNISLSLLTPYKGAGKDNQTREPEQQKITGLCKLYHSQEELLEHTASSLDYAVHPLESLQKHFIAH